MKSLMRKALLTAGLVSLAGSSALPDHPLSLVGRLLVLVLAEYSIFYGIRSYRAQRSWRSHLSHPDPWALLGAALALHGLADVLSYVSSPDSASALSHLVGYLRSACGLGMVALTGLALMDMMRQRFGDRCGDHVYEAIIVAATVSLLLWVTLIEPVLRTHHQPISAGMSSAAAMTIILVLASLSFNLMASFTRRPTSFVALTLSQVILVLSSTLSFTAEITGSALIAAAVAGLPTLASVAVAFGALEPTMSIFEEPTGPAGARLGRVRLAALIVPVVLSPLALTLCLTKTVPLSPLAISAYSVTLSLLVVGHLIAMVQARASSTHWASHDKLTGLPNRALFRERAAQALDRARKLGTPVSIMYLDLDRFKHINDSMGHEAGDQLLEQVARRILACVDSGDTVARLGGDEFAILLPSMDDERVPRMLARRLLKTFSSPFNLKPRPVFMSPSIGIAVGEGAVSLETLMTQADTAMYRAKESGRNNFAVWSQEMNEAAKQRLTLETHLHSAITNDELRLVYQPKVELATGNVVGVEALIRWHHPKLGVISPGVFIHLAEESGLINQIGEWVLETACAQARAWYESGFTNLSMAVNLSSRQFQQKKMADVISKVLRSTRLDASLLELELTESVAMSGEDSTLSTLEELRAMGVKTSIDDFGTGYSNLSYLSRFPIDNLKIDRSFIEQIDKSGGDAAIVVAIIAMAHGLGLNVIAEGVETPEQAAFLAKHNCDEMQGYLFSRPLPAAELEGLLMLEHVASGDGRLGLSALNGGGPRRLERAMPEYDRLVDPHRASAQA